MWATFAVLAAGSALFFRGHPHIPVVGYDNSGHWVLGPGGMAVHINGGTRKIDAEVDTGPAGDVDGQPPAVLEGNKGNAYVFRNDASAPVIDGSTLTVRPPIHTGIHGGYVGIEAHVGGVYVVSKPNGTVFRPDISTSDLIQVGGPVSDPVVTDDGTLWLLRTDAGTICILPAKAKALDCSVRVPATHRGSLVVVQKRPAFIDLTTNSVRPVVGAALGPDVPLGVDVPAGAQVATADLGGWLPIVDNNSKQVLLADLNGFTKGRRGRGPLRIPLNRQGQYGTPVTGQGVFAVPDEVSNRLLVFGPNGHLLHDMPVHAQGARYTVGQDGQIYVDMVDRAHAFVVARNGWITEVNVSAPPQNALPRPNATPAPHGAVPVAAQPGPIGSVAVTVGDGTAQIIWTGPNPNWPPVRAYRVTWIEPDGRRHPTTSPGSQRTLTITGLHNGTAYTASVAANNRLGWGPETYSGVFVPSTDAPGAPTGVQARAATDGTVQVTWRRADGKGHDIARYDLFATGSDGSSSAVGQASGTSATVAGLTLGVGYTFTVTATTDVDVTSPASAPSDTATPVKPADAPTNITATPDDGSLTLRWSAPNLNGGVLDHYVVTPSGGGATSQSTTATSLSYTGLRNGTSYSFTVSAVTHSPDTGTPLSGAAAPVSATPGRTPTVDIATIGLSGDRQVSVRFSVIDYGSGPVTCFIFFDDVERWVGPCQDGDTASVDNLDYSRTYDVNVKGANAFGYGARSAKRQVTTNSPSPQVAVSRGTPRSPDAVCNDPSCAWVNVSLANFPPNTNHRVDCVSSGPRGGSGTYYTYTVRTDGSGTNTSSMCFYGYAGQSVWAVVDGVESNHFPW